MPNKHLTSADSPFVVDFPADSAGGGQNYFITRNGGAAGIILPDLSTGPQTLNQRVVVTNLSDSDGETTVTPSGNVSIGGGAPGSGVTLASTPGLSWVFQPIAGGGYSVTPGQV